MSPSSNPMPSIIDRVVALRNRGATYGQIAARVGIGRGAVSGILYRQRNPRPVRPARPDMDISSVSDLPYHEARYILAVTLGLGYSRVARMVGLSVPTIRHSCHKVEDRRDDPQYDEWLTGVEEARVLLSGNIGENGSAGIQGPTSHT